MEYIVIKKETIRIGLMNARLSEQEIDDAMKQLDSVSFPAQEMWDAAKETVSYCDEVDPKYDDMYDFLKTKA